MADVHDTGRIAVCGALGSGKTTTAQHLAALYGGRVLSFAYPLKQVARGMAKVGGQPEPGRAEFQELSRYRVADTWLNIMDYNLAGRDHPVFVDDLRFPEEADFLIRRGFFVVRLWVSPAELDRRRLRRDGRLPDPATLAHESEQHWPNLPVHAEISGDYPLANVTKRVVEEYRAWVNNQYSAARTEGVA